MEPPTESAWTLPRLLSRAIGAGGALAIFAAIFFPWFSVPGLAGEPIWSAIFRALTVAFCIAAMAQIRSRTTVVRLAQLAFAYFAALLLFPYFITVWSPRFSGEASWLHAQHESLTGSSGDLYLSQEDKGASWRQRVDIVNRPIDSAVFDFPDWTALDFERVIDACSWFGGSPWFALFVRKGWVLALGGAAAMLLALLGESGEPRALAAAIFRRGLPIFSGVLALVFLPIVATIFLLLVARHATARGDYLTGAHALDRAALCVPALREDGCFVMQRGLLDEALHVASPEADLFRARLLEMRGFDAEAQSQYLAGIDRGSSPTVRREYFKALLSRAADALNSGEVNAATALYSAVLAQDPKNLKANYALQLIAVRAADLERLHSLQTEMIATYRAFNTPTKQAVLALSHENSALAEVLDGNAPAAWQALARARNP